ncbi:MAG: hypothetical protein ACRDGO_11300 [Actinomycetota bacterium]
MQREPRVQVVLGEAERADGLLRFVLEAEGFDLVGLASSDEELSRVLRGAKPSVVVLDGGISAAAALDARQRLDGAALVVVWPDGVSAVLAEERVEPHMVIEALGDAVRRAAARVERADTIVVPDVVTQEPAQETPVPQHDPVVEIGNEPPLPQPWRRPRRGAQVLVAAATWLLVITAFTAIAAAVPHVVDTFRGKLNGPRPSSAPPSERPASQIVSPAIEPEGSAEPNRCEDEVSGEGADGADGSADGAVRAQGCPTDRERTDGAGGGGKPEEPGRQGGVGSSGGPPEETGDPGQSPHEDDPSDGVDDQRGKSEEHGNAGAEQALGERGRSGEAGRSEQHA